MVNLARQKNHTVLEKRPQGVIKQEYIIQVSENINQVVNIDLILSLSLWPTRILP